MKKLMILVSDLMNHGYSREQAMEFLGKCLGLYLNLSDSEKMMANLFIASNDEQDELN